MNLVISYSSKRAGKDEYNRQRGLKRLKKSMGKGKMTKAHLNNRGYNKFLKMDGELKISLDEQKIVQDKKWDGLKGYLTNCDLSSQEVMASYQQLWQIEKAFRISKTDLKIRPVFHYRKRRIEAHICICFCAYKLYKELERRLREAGSMISPTRAIEAVSTIYGIEMTLPKSKKTHTHLIAKEEIHQKLREIFLF
ncbi:MAG: IS1634 family transposase [Bacteroidota bacterium]